MSPIPNGRVAASRIGMSMAHMYRDKIIAYTDVMSAETLPKVRMPNRDGFVARHPERH